MPKKNNNNNNDGRYEENLFWKYWKKTVLEDLDELRNHIIDIRMEQARIAMEQEEIQLRIDRIEDFLRNEIIIEIELEGDDGGDFEQ